MTKSSEQPAHPTSEQAVRSSLLSDKPFLRFYHSDSLRAKTFTVLATLEQAQDSTRHRNILSDLVLELTDTGLEYFFLRPLKLAKVSFVVEQSAHMGMGGVKRVMAPVIRNIIGHMDKHQLLTVCSHIRQLME